MEELGELTGILIIGLFVLLGMRYVLRIVFAIYGKTMSADTRKLFVSLMTLNRKVHPFLSYAIFILIITHAYIQTGFKPSFSYAEVTGMIAATLLILNSSFGFVGQNILHNPRPKWWRPFHGIMTLIIMVAIATHYIS